MKHQMKTLLTLIAVVVVVVVVGEEDDHPTTTTRPKKRLAVNTSQKCSASEQMMVELEKAAPGVFMKSKEHQAKVKCKECSLALCTQYTDGDAN
jgi:hypothetical protein